MQILSTSVARMIRDAIKDIKVVVSLTKKDMLNHLADLCEKWNNVVDICNGRDGPHTPENTSDKQSTLLDILSWFAEWKAMPSELLDTGATTKYNFSTVETWFCIRALILTQVGAI